MKQPKCPHDHRDCPVLTDFLQLQAEHEKLRDLVSIDELTGLFNFRFLKSALEGEMERTRRTGLSTGLIMVDLDHFKKINDTYGHENGNLALQAAARIWINHLRKIDIPCRYGGEEFIIILPNTKIHDAIRAAQRLRAELAAATINLNMDSVHLTASFGVDEYREGEDMTADAFIHRVDMYVLDAKKKGRNRVCYDRRKVARPVTEVTAEERASLFTKRKI
ncbi:MAG: GGDEF domain-containing protein [Desulfobacterales bacterium]|nr:GGDEF domain-containing protein [Desulfobacterales bacterium]